MCWELFLLLNKIRLCLLAVNVAGSPKEVQSGGAGQGVVVQGDQAVGTGMNIVTEIIGPIASATEMNDMIVIITEVMKGGVTLDGGVLAAV
jgi:L-asparaginase/Glu-tRNA(Gln) amidotransferase subunit D